MKKLISLTICVIVIFSLISQTASAAAPDPKLLSAPYDLTVTQIILDDANPYGGVTLHFKIDNLPDPDAEGSNSEAYWLDFERKIGSGPWEEFGANPIGAFAGETNGFIPPNIYTATDTWGEEAVAEVRFYRVRMMIYNTMEVSAATPWSNIAAVGISASSWATAYVQKALDYGLIPDSIMGDFTKPITREEFAELSVKLYERYTGKTAAPAPETTFSDTKNPEILKAFQLNIVSGVGGGKFDPKTTTTREQIASMLYRAAKAMKPNGNFSTAGAPVFNDDKLISGWAHEGVLYMAKMGFIGGVGNNRFDPAGTCTREMAVIIAVKAYEFYSKAG